MLWLYVVAAALAGLLAGLLPAAWHARRRRAAVRAFGPEPPQAPVEDEDDPSAALIDLQALLEEQRRRYRELEARYRDRALGEVIATGHVRIKSGVGPSLSASGDVEVGPAALIEADLRGESIAVEGRVQGCVTGRRQVRLGPDASVSGDVRAPRLTVREGAILNGRVTMGVPETKALHPRSSGPGNVAQPGPVEKTAAEPVPAEAVPVPD